jgi:hypothetical protein
MPHYSRTLCGSLLIAVTLTLGALAQEQQDPPRKPRQFHAPWNNDLVISESRDGRTFDATERRVFVERGGVPCVMRDGKDRLLAVFQWFPFERREAFDRVAVVISEDEGKTWSKPEPIAVEGLPEGAQRPFDPTLVLLQDGKLRLYFTCTTPQRRIPGIYSAISDDGVKYRFEEGMRFGVEGKKVIDPAIARFRGKWHLISPADGPEPIAHHAVSDDGLTYERLEDVEVPVRGSWIGNLVAEGEHLHFYGSGARQGWMAQSNDGAKWEVLTAELRVGGDPAPIKRKDGSWFAVATGPGRRDGARPPFLPVPPTPPSAAPQ